MTGLRTSATDLQEFGERAFEAVGVSGEDATIVTRSLVDADLRGLDEHGALARLPVYTSRLRAGGTSAATEITTTADLGALVTLDANGGLGQLTAHTGMSIAVERAERHGVGLVTATNANHLGVLGYWSAMAAQHGLVGFALSSASARLAPWGGSTPLLSSSPWSWAFPVDGGRPVVVDSANTSVVPMVISAAKRRGEPIPAGVALDAMGRPTTDPEAAMGGTILPFGGAKGAALNLAMDVLSTILPDAALSSEVAVLTDYAEQQHLGHVFLAVRTDAGAQPGTFGTRLAGLIELLTASPPAEGSDGVRIPGSRRDDTHDTRVRNGIPLSEPTAARIAELATTLSVPPLVTTHVP